MICKTHQQYDQHSSEEELEVINGPSSCAGVAESNLGAISSDTSVRVLSSLVSERGSSSVDFDELCGETETTLKRSSSTLIETRKRSMAHSSDDDVRFSDKIKYIT